MKINYKFFKKKKIAFIKYSFYIVYGTNLIGGERGIDVLF